MALWFPTAVDLKDLQDVEGKFSGESLPHEFSILFLCCLSHLFLTLYSNVLFSFNFLALQPEQELDLAQLAEADTQDATEYGTETHIGALEEDQGTTDRGGPPSCCSSGGMWPKSIFLL